MSSLSSPASGLASSVSGCTSFSSVASPEELGEKVAVFSGPLSAPHVPLHAGLESGAQLVLGKKPGYRLVWPRKRLGSAEAQRLTCHRAPPCLLVTCEHCPASPTRASPWPCVWPPVPGQGDRSAGDLSHPARCSGRPLPSGPPFPASSTPLSIHPILHPQASSHPHFVPHSLSSCHRSSPFLRSLGLEIQAEGQAVWTGVRTGSRAPPRPTWPSSAQASKQP